MDFILRISDSMDCMHTPFVWLTKQARNQGERRTRNAHIQDKQTATMMIGKSRANFAIKGSDEICVIVCSVHSVEW